MFRERLPLKHKVQHTAHLLYIKAGALDVRKTTQSMVPKNSNGCCIFCRLMYGVNHELFNDPAILSIINVLHVLMCNFVSEENHFKIQKFVNAAHSICVCFTVKLL